MVNFPMLVWRSLSVVSLSTPVFPIACRLFRPRQKLKSLLFINLQPLSRNTRVGGTPNFASTQSATYSLFCRGPRHCCRALLSTFNPQHSTRPKSFRIRFSGICTRKFFRFRSYLLYGGWSPLYPSSPFENRKARGTTDERNTLGTASLGYRVSRVKSSPARRGRFCRRGWRVYRTGRRGMASTCGAEKNGCFVRVGIDWRRVEWPHRRHGAGGNRLGRFAPGRRCVGGPPTYFTRAGS